MFLLSSWPFTVGDSVCGLAYVVQAHSERFSRFEETRPFRLPSPIRGPPLASVGIHIHPSNGDLSAVVVIEVEGESYFRNPTCSVLTSYMAPTIRISPLSSSLNLFLDNQKRYQELSQTVSDMLERKQGLIRGRWLPHGRLDKRRVCEHDFTREADSRQYAVLFCP